MEFHGLIRELKLSYMFQDVSGAGGAFVSRDGIRSEEAEESFQRLCLKLCIQHWCVLSCEHTFS